MLLTERDQKMFAKYYGRFDLLNDDKFWQDILEIYKEADVPLPLINTPQGVRLFLDFLDCPSGECGECCNKYWWTLINTREIKRISASSEENARLLQEHLKEKDGKKYIYGPCPFLKDNTCSIYEIRPDTCYFYPLQLEKHDIVELDGQKREMLSARVKCPASVKAIRSVFTEMMGKSNKLLLLPNLNIIQMEDK